MRLECPLMWKWASKKGDADNRLKIADGCSLLTAVSNFYSKPELSSVHIFERPFLLHFFSFEVEEEVLLIETIYGANLIHVKVSERPETT